MASNGKRKPLSPKREVNPPQRFLRLPEVMERIGLRHTQIYALMRATDFRNRCASASSAVAWLESEIDAFQQERIAERDGADQ